MEVCFHDSPEEFRDRVWPTLMEREGENNLILGTISRLLSGEIARPELLASIEDDGAVVGVCIKIPQRGMTVTRMPCAAAELLAAAVTEKLDDLPGVLGPSEAARSFSETWAALGGVKAYVRYRFRGYELEKVIPAPPVSGGMVQAGPQDADLVADWAAAMAQELDMQMPDAREQGRGWVERGESFLWRDGQPVAMAQFQLATPTCPRVRMVYTPPSARRHGYATALVAALSARMLTSGCPRCFLFTDEDNPTSNGIYMKIGYRPVCDWEDVRFREL